MRIVVTGGGTGGHIYPALSVARALEGHEIDFVGSTDGPEARIVPAAGLRFHALPARKMSRRGPDMLISLAVAAWGVGRSIRLLRALRPDVVLSTGGYASASLAVGAALMRVPTLIHEGNAIPGRTNRLLGRFVSRVAISFEEVRRAFPPGKTVFTGFPIRPEFGAGRAERARAEFGLDDRPLVFAFGGSGGARSINCAVEGAFPQLEELGVQVLHQTGRGTGDESRQEADGRRQTAGSGPVARPDWYHPVPYVEGMADALAAAAVVVCRAGASTLSEVTAEGRPALLVPYPHAHADHQTANARALVEAGAATLVPDGELNPSRLVHEVGAILMDPTLGQRMAAASRRLARPDAAQRVAEELEQLAGCGASRGRVRGRAAA